ncbi:hypothetical protein KDA_00240 [Dictyobacter alpinus]|uniref:Uncharacterized protein n=1 Tax=Dictyobacter alpinus TaxID=2014873 RepID=A0A402AZK6_9CHLR|nr:hypothetical protein [Dictyobacter alpinus]GCE24540.1 hypothetical protein KDA_00240 [Dictyobacter alpinus]
MENRLLGYEHAATVNEVAMWANGLLGKEVPGEPGYTVVKIIQFQLIQISNGYDVLVLVEVKEELEPLNLKKSDVEAIIDITSAVDDRL